ncbi:MAG TPA: hypothetical protein VFU68_03180 [Terracidiphilus sp.]|nr:hypothetical protein [Terracidiphilus sp.]
MPETHSPSRRILDFCARALIVIGAIVFLLGDRFLADFANISFFLALVIGILSGLLLMIAGYLINKSLK